MELKGKFLKAVLDCAEGIYIIEEKTKKVCYVNEFFEERGITFIEGENCFYASSGRRETCSFCPSLKEAEEGKKEIYTWEYYDSKTCQWYRVKNCLIRVEGVLYRVGNVNTIGDMMELGRDAVGEIASMQKVIEERNQIQKILEYESSHDRLTGIYNRNSYSADIAAFYPEEFSIGILFFDLNNLKYVNDNYGHSEGDRLLCRLSNAMTAVKDTRIRCYRVGGDEFVLIFQRCSKKELQLCRKTILANIEKENQTEDIKCSVAIGNAWQQSGCKVEALATEADFCMYKNKRRMEK